ncbi:hypothetical protein Tco_1203075 [Tanacetum coccineum]
MDESCFCFFHQESEASARSGRLPKNPRKFTRFGGKLDECLLWCLINCFNDRLYNDHVTLEGFVTVAVFRVVTGLLMRVADSRFDDASMRLVIWLLHKNYGVADNLIDKNVTDVVIDKGIVDNVIADNVIDKF